MYQALQKVRKGGFLKIETEYIKDFNNNANYSNININYLKVTDFLSYQPNLPSPVQQIRDRSLEARGVALSIKREDRIHPWLSGNKWRKLKYNLKMAVEQGKNRLLSFGGAYSNHLYALAAAGRLFQFQTIGVVRGERPSRLNPTLSFAESRGMKLEFISRQLYRQRHEEVFLNELAAKYPDAYIIPEGGTNALALRGCQEIITESFRQCEADVYAVACATGGTMGGMIKGLEGKKWIVGFSVLKGTFLSENIRNLLEPQCPANWTINEQYHFGGYAKFNSRLIDFINTFYSEHRIPLEPIYTGKMLYGLYDLINQGYFPPGSSILAVHTGGLQGLAGMEQRFGPLFQQGKEWTEPERGVEDQWEK